ncbi:MAG: shikimate dehydrogenase [Wenzhouxiangella sp.]
MSKRLKLALFGDPVEHSRSPEIHRLFGEQTGIALDYTTIRCSPQAFGPRFAAFLVGGGVGANLTLPLKQVGLGVCQQVDPDARAARAVNTLVKRDDGWHGYNTDGPGLLLDLQGLCIPVKDQRILIIGAGGATAGILAPLLAQGPQIMVVLNRTGARAESLAEKHAHRGHIVGCGFEQTERLQDFDLLIQASSSGHQGELPPLKRRWLKADARAYDLNYGPAHRPFADWCAEGVLPCHDGLGMLVGQAALAFEIWTGQRPDVVPVISELRARSGG